MVHRNILAIFWTVSFVHWIQVHALPHQWSPL